MNIHDTINTHSLNETYNTCIVINKSENKIILTCTHQCTLYSEQL